MWWRWSALQELMSSKSSEPSLTGISSGQSPLELMGQHRPSARLNTAQHYVTQPITSQANVMSWCNCCLEVYSPGAQKWTPGWRCRMYLEHMSANHLPVNMIYKIFCGYPDNNNKYWTLIMSETFVPLWCILCQCKYWTFMLV